MSVKKERTGYILVGIFIGLLIGISVMWWQSSFNKKSWFSFQKVSGLVKSLYSTTDEFFSNVKTTFSIEKSNSQKKTAVNPSDTLNKNKLADSLNHLDSMGVNNFYGSNGMDYFIDADKLPDSLLWFGSHSRIKAGRDSIVHDTTHYRYSSVSGDNIVVKRDELLMTRMIRVIGMSDTTDQHGAYLDSLLTNDKMSKHLPSNLYRVEFWRSPVNYSGYKLVRNRMIIYGIYDPDNVTLEFINRRLYLRNQNSYYLVEPTENFRSLNAVRKQEISGKGKRL